MARDGLEPAGEQLELFEDPGFSETIVHKAGVFSSGLGWWWSCTCGQTGQPTTEGRAYGGRRRHMTAARRRARARAEW
jgi:hypothetical protein